MDEFIPRTCERVKGGVSQIIGPRDVVIRGGSGYLSFVSTFNVHFVGWASCG